MSYLDCGPLTNPTNGTVDTSAGTTAGNTATYSCNTGYNLDGNSVVQCRTDGTWNGTAPRCLSNIIINCNADCYKSITLDVF